MIDLQALYPLRSWPKVVDATCYNQARLALRRIANPLRVTLPGHRGLQVILGDRAWLCVDALRDDQPVLAWCDFETAGRGALHEPVHCRLNVYHLHAGLIMGSALEALAHGLQAELHGRTPD